MRIVRVCLRDPSKKLALAACAACAPSARRADARHARMGSRRGRGRSAEPILRTRGERRRQRARRRSDPRSRSASHRCTARASESRRAAAEAALAELRHGTRIETIDASRATLAGAESTQQNAKRERDRLAEIRKRGLIAADLDNAETALRTATAQSNNARANLTELLNGTRIEDIEQAEAALASAQANVDHLTLTRARLDVRAPRAAASTRCRSSSAISRRLAPTSSACSSATRRTRACSCPRAARATCSRARASASAWKASARRSRRRCAASAARPSFTPYYALTGDDASRLVYRAELVLDGDGARIAGRVAVPGTLAPSGSAERTTAAMTPAAARSASRSSRAG